MVALTTAAPTLILLHFFTVASGRFHVGQRNVSSGPSSPQRPEDEDTTGPCHSFLVGDPDKQELYSPNYPHNYPNHSDCIRILHAEPGSVLRLDFRDEFHVEPSEDCRFDYLEVRDGEHGYSPLVGKFCGSQFPPMLTSTSRYLWLRFRSDENIEYSGFKAVYSSIPRPTSNGREVEVPPCRLIRSGVEGYVNRSDIPQERVLASLQHNLPLDCMWVIVVDHGWKIHLMFVKFSLERPNDCESNFIDVFPERTDLPSRLHNFCGSMAEMVASKGNVLHVRFMADPKAINSSFEIVFTAFRDRAKDEVCAEGEYDCEDATCISESLRCNGRANCRFRWDEDDCKSDVNTLGRLLQEEHMVIILIIFFMILTGMCSAFIYNCARKLVRDSQMIKEQIQHSFSGGREDLLCQKIPVATVLTPLSSILPVSVPSSVSTSPGLQRPVGSPCHVPSAGDVLPVLQPLHQNLPLDYFTHSNVESSTDKESSSTAEVKDGESQTRESQFLFTSVDSLMPPPPPPPRASKIFMETDLDFHPRFPLNRQEPTHMLPSIGHSRSDENLSRVRCSDGPWYATIRRAAPDVIATH